MLATTEPQNPVHRQNYQQVSGAWRDHRPQPASLPKKARSSSKNLEATAPVIDQSYPDSVAIAVRSAVTDADLFLSYNLPDKAVVPLLAALPQAPSDARLNQRLAALHTSFHRFSEAAVCCRTFESVYHDAGYPDEATRYGELAARYENSAELAPSSTSAASTIAATSPIASAVGAAATAGPEAKPEPWPTAQLAATGHASRSCASRIHGSENGGECALRPRRN
jgi:hypothetical protein